MNENMDYPVLEFEDCINYIADKTKLDKEIIESVLNAETESIIFLSNLFLEF